jgi:hypothetical protein
LIFDPPSKGLSAVPLSLYHHPFLSRISIWQIPTILIKINDTLILCNPFITFLEHKAMVLLKAVKGQTRLQLYPKNRVILSKQKILREQRQNIIILSVSKRIKFQELSHRL